MTNPAANPMDAVAALMLERQRYEDWIAQLESRRSITPPHVFERVRGDYEARLREVLQQLSGRTAEVQATAAALTERLARMQSEETAIRDERYEAELRSHVGEVTAAQWSAIERESDERIAKLTAERTTITGEIARLQQLLSMTGGRTAPASQASKEVPEAAKSEKATEPPRSGSFDELEFLKSVTDGTRSGAAAAGKGAAPAAAPAPARTSAAIPKAGTPAGGSANVGVGTAPAAGGNGAAPNAGTVPAPEPTFSGSQSGSATNDGSEEPSNALPEREPDAVPSFLRDVPQEQTKTLRCGECDAMNYPTEWYCERCGAELAGM